MTQVYLNGDFLSPEAARISPWDRGFLFGDGVYEVIPAYRGRPFFWEAHLDRLHRSLAAIDLAVPAIPWQEIFSQLIGPAPRDCALYLQITRGTYATRDHRFPEAVQPTVFAFTWDLKPPPKHGVAGITREDFRWDRCDIKSIALLGNVLLRQSATEAQAHEALLFRKGWLTEGSSSNVFAVLGGKLCTPPESHRLLSGITRALVLQLAEQAGLSHEEREIHRDELDEAEEIWITSSTREVLPLIQLDGKPVGSGQIGSWWRQMDQWFQQYKRDWLAAHD